MSTACWLWDYLRRSKASGYFLALSGGADSCATSVIGYIMCHLVFQNIENQEILNDLQKIVRDNTFIPKSPQEIMGRIFYTAYMHTNNSS